MAELTLTQSAAATVVGRGYLASDHLSTATGLDPAIMISKNGGNFANPAAGASVMTEIEATGWYKFALGTDDTDTLGPLIIRGTHATMDNIEVVYQVVAEGVTLADDAITSDKYDESTAYPLYSDTPIVRVGGFIDTAGSVPTDILASAFPADATGYSFISGLDGYGDDALNGAILLDSTSTWMACVTDYVSLTGTITLDKTIPAALQEADFILIPSASAGGGGASAADVWANATRTLTALDEDDTTIDLDGITIGTVTTVTNGVTLADDAITAAKYNNTDAFPLAAVDSGSTYIARTGADSDTLETLSDQVDLQAVATELAKVPKSDGAVTWNVTALGSINADDKLIRYDLENYSSAKKTEKSK